MTTMKSFDLEETVLAAMIIDDECALDVELLREKDFTRDVNREIYKAIKSLVKKQEAVDYMTIYKESNQKIDLTYLVSLDEKLPSTANFEKYVEDLKDLTLKRDLRTLLNEVTNSELTGKEAAEIAEQKIFELRDDTSVDEFYSALDLALDTFKDIEEIQAGKSETLLESGYDAIDRILGGFRKGDYILLGGRPSMGKTALAINIAEKVIDKGHKVAIFSYEMTANQLMQRMIAGSALVDSGKISKVRGKLEAKEWSRITKAANHIANQNLYINDDPTLTVADMQSMARKLKAKEGLDLIIIDYLQKVRSTTNEGSRQQIEQVSSDIKNMAKLLDVPVIVVSSLSRASETRNDKRPTLSDLRESGQLEFDADVVMFLHRENYYDPEADPLAAELIVAKHRNGPVGLVDLIWKREYTKFFDVARE